MQKNLKATLVYRFFQSIWFYTQRKDGANTSRFWSPTKKKKKKKVTAIMMLYWNKKVKVYSADGDTDFFNIIAGVLHGDTWAPSLFIICLDCVLWMSIDLIKENGLTLKKARSRQYPTETTTDKMALLANIPAQAKSLLHSLE